MVPLTKEDADRIERKLDLIISAMGLSEDHRRAPIEIEEMAKGDLLQFRLRRQKKAQNDNKTS
jgi:hypothetical protein